MAGNPCPHGRLGCVYCKPPRAQPPRRCPSCFHCIGRYDAICAVCAELGIEAPPLFDERS